MARQMTPRLPTSRKYVKRGLSERMPEDLGVEYSHGQWQAGKP